MVYRIWVSEVFKIISIVFDEVVFFRSGSQWVCVIIFFLVYELGVGVDFFVVIMLLKIVFYLYSYFSRKVFNILFLKEDKQDSIF